MLGLFHSVALLHNLFGNESCTVCPEAFQTTVATGSNTVTQCVCTEGYASTGTSGTAPYATGLMAMIVTPSTLEGPTDDKTVASFSWTSAAAATLAVTMKASTRTLPHVTRR